MKIITALIMITLCAGVALGQRMPSIQDDISGWAEGSINNIVNISPPPIRWQNDAAKKEDNGNCRRRENLSKRIYDLSDCAPDCTEFFRLLDISKAMPDCNLELKYYYIDNATIELGIQDTGEVDEKGEKIFDIKGRVKR